MLVFAWDSIRVALGADSFWSVGVVGYGGLRLIWPHELWPRLRAWSEMMSSLFKSPLANGLLLVGLSILIGRGLIRRQGMPGRRAISPKHRCIPLRQAQDAFFDLLLVSFCLFYVLLHWLVAFPIWGRYLLPLVPVLAVLLGRIVRESAALWSDHSKLGRRVDFWSRHCGRFAHSRSAYDGAAGDLAQAPWLISVLLLALLLIVPAREASAGRSSLSEDRAAYRGVDDVVSFYSELPEGSVVYHHWLGWHYHYALFDGPVYLAYWPTPSWLARDVQAFGRQDPRYVAFPAWESAARVERALGDVGYALDPVLAVTPGVQQASHSGDVDGSFIVYRIVPWPSPNPSQGEGNLAPV